jgi:predicted ATPase
MPADSQPSRDRICRVRFQGLRTAKNVQLDCEPMNVLIGPNGVGKSTLIEGLEILRKIELGNDFVRALNDEHGGASHLLRHGASELKLGISIMDGATGLAYEITLSPRGGNLVIAQEWLWNDNEMLFARDGEVLTIGKLVAQDAKPNPISPRMPALAALSVFSPLIARMTAVLAGIEVHVPFATQARWFGPGMVPERNMRVDNIVQSTDRLDRAGANLANAFHALRNRSDWLDTLDTIKLVVDDDITEVITPAAASGGAIGLAVNYRTSGTVPSFALSDGTLALLALIAIIRLDGGDTPRSLLVLDEPDLHLDPGTVGQVVALLEECSARQPVVIATHSDRLLDCLSEPARSAVLCDLDEQRRLRVRRPDQALLDRWLKQYRGLGDLRAEGYDQLVFPLPPLRAAENT